MAIYNFILKNWLWLAIVIGILAAFIIISAFIYSSKKVRTIKLVKQKSILYKKIMELNSKTHFNELKTEFKIREVYHTRKQFEKANTHDIFLNYIKNNLHNAGDFIECMEENLETYKDYMEKYKKLASLQSTDGTRAFKRVERKLFCQLALKPKLNASFLCSRYFRDTKSRTIYENYTNFDFDALKVYYYQAGGKPRQQQQKQTYNYEQKYQQKQTHHRHSGTYNPPPEPKKIHLELYRHLEVSHTASQDEIKTAYRKLAKRYHPDINKDTPDAAEKFKQINTAYAVLSDPDKRIIYDRDGRTD